MGSLIGHKAAVIASAIADCMCVAVRDEGGGPLCFCGVVGGAEPSWDYCGSCDGPQCGMGYVILSSVFPYETFPDQSSDPTCALGWAATFRVGVIRCFPSPDESGDMPTEAEQGEVAVATHLDMGAMLDAVRCCDLPEVSFGSWDAIGPQGGCGGGEWTVTVDLN